MQYRYDAFGGMFTGITSPYNTVGFTGKSYDPKAELVEFYARWYDPSVGRFTTQDSYLGELVAPASQHRYAYVLNNPATHVDRWGYYVPPDPEGDPEIWSGPYIKTTYESESWDDPSSWEEVHGDYLFIYTVVTRYTDRYAVVTHFMKSNWGNIEEVWVDRNLIGSSSEVISRSTRQVWLGNDDGGDGEDEDDNGDIGGGGLTDAQKAVLKEAELALKAGWISQDDYGAILASSAEKQDANWLNTAPPEITRWKDLIIPAANKNQLDPALLAAVMEHESGGTNITKINPTGDVGVMQLNLRAQEVTYDQAVNPAFAVFRAARYLGGLVSYFRGDAQKAVQAYNYGEGNVGMLVKKYGDQWMAHRTEIKNGDPKYYEHVMQYYERWK